jgi:uncharacterized protein YbjT (DUF2867 family)
MEAWLSPMVGFDAANAKAQIFGGGTNPVSYISYKDVARFAMESLNNPNARKAILELGGPEKISQLDAVKIFEKINGRKFEIQHLPADALQSRLDALTDPMEKTFTGLMLCIAKGDPIDMRDILKKYPVKLTSVKEYAKSMVVVL